MEVLGEVECGKIKTRRQKPVASRVRTLRVVVARKVGVAATSEISSILLCHLWSSLLVTRLCHWSEAVIIAILRVFQLGNRTTSAANAPFVLASLRKTALNFTGRNTFSHNSSYHSALADVVEHQTKPRRSVLCRPAKVPFGWELGRRAPSVKKERWQRTPSATVLIPNGYWGLKESLILLLFILSKTSAVWTYSNTSYFFITKFFVTYISSAIHSLHRWISTIEFHNHIY